MNSSQVLWALIAVLGVQAVTDLGVLGLERREAVLSRWLPFLVSGAAGVLLATACLDLLPEAVRAATSGRLVWEILLATLLGLFCLQASASSFGGTGTRESSSALDGAGTDVEDRELQPHVHPHPHGQTARQRTPAALLLGSALHSGVDGLAIAAAFSAGGRPGWTAAVAIGLHEIPHRLGDFALLVHMGIPRRPAAQLAIGAGATALLGWLAVAGLGRHQASAPWLLPVSAATFLYIALVDLVPELQANGHGRSVWWQVLCLLAGAALIAVIVHLPGA